MKRRQKKEFNKIRARKIIPYPVTGVYRPKKRRPGTKAAEKVKGIFRAHPRGFGFVTPLNEETENGGEEGRDIFISADDTRNAMNKDTVEVLIFPEYTGEKRREGRVTRIIKRGTTAVIGTFREYRRKCWVISDDPRFTVRISVREENKMGAADGDRVVCSITDYGSNVLSPRGIITEILGHEGDTGTDILAIARMMEVPVDFPEKVMNQSERVPDHVLTADYAGREDLRDWQIVTIDGADARDLDDAVSLTRDGEDYILGVHIADVSNYVQENSALDREALRRGTSVYLADRVIPMLPERLSNGICSLNAGADRLTLSCIMRLDKKGRVISHRIAESVIRVGERMTYSDVRSILEDHDAALTERYAAYVPMFRDMYELSLLIRTGREKRGAIDFDFPEAKVVLDDLGLPTEIIAQRADCATRIIEDFMLTANETVAEHFFKDDMPFVYRIHEDPDPEKMEKVLTFVRKQGVPIEKTKQKITPKEIQNTLRAIRGEPTEPMISRIILRSMQQARYETSCDGHFGLAAKYYCHFTSPIRRYPDLQIHRIIHDCIRGRMTAEKKRHYADILGDVAGQSSRTERRAAEAERETVRFMKAQYMLAHVGETFEGVISSLTNWGIYVELPNTVEGMIRISDIISDHYAFDENAQSVTGLITGKEYRLGDTVHVIMKNADPTMRTIDFQLAENDRDARPDE